MVIQVPVITINSKSTRNRQFEKYTEKEPNERYQSELVTTILGPGPDGAGPDLDISSPSLSSPMSNSSSLSSHTSASREALGADLELWFGARGVVCVGRS